VVTIVFADLAGSTTLEERMDPESVRAVMQRYYRLVREVVEARQGRVVKFIGDGAMAVFGVPETHEDDALQALDAALALHGAFGALADELARDRGVAISLRVGVNTGEVVVGDGDDDVVGDAVNVAARLERAAAPGAVLVGEGTWRLARGEAVFEDVQELHVAGKAEKVRARTLIRVQHGGSEARVEFVGRSHEIEALQSDFNDVVETGSPRLVTVVGSPGVGKTRLGAELERMVTREATVLMAACTQQTAVPLAPVVEMLQGVLASEQASPFERLARLFGERDFDRERVLGTLTAVLETGAAATPEETLWALRRLMESLARTRPVVLIVDDLHWAESMLLDLVEHLAEWTRGPLLLVALARPELRDRRAALADGVRHRLLPLEGLDRGATVRLACQLLAADALPVALLDRLPTSTGGNPLFVRELLHMLVDDEVLAADDDGRWELRVRSEAIDVPPTIQSLLAARLDRLSAGEQAVLERASISGAEFPLGALVELLPAERRREAPVVIEQLRRKELVESAGSYWIDEPVYRFHHVLIRDAAYRRLLREDRAALHETMAAWIDAKTSAIQGEYDELAGHHLEQAYLQRRELGPLDEHMVRVGRTAGRRLGAAAQRALDRDDPAAASLAGRALDCLPAGDAARAELLLVRCEALLSAGDAVHARDAVAELEGVAPSSPRLRAWAACFAAQLATLIDPTHLRETEQGAAAVTAELAALGDDRGTAKAHAVHAAALARLGRFAEVEDALDQALTAAHRAGDRRLATVALAAAPVAAVWGPSPVPRAGGRCLDVVRLLRITAGSPVVEATSLRCQAVLEAFRGRIDAARRLVTSAHEMLMELGLVHGLLEADMFAAIVEIISGDVEAADERLRHAYDGLRQLGAEADAARAGALLARVEMERGNLEEAERLARQTEDLAGDDLQAGILWRRVTAEVLARRGHQDEAMALAVAAVGIASRTDALVQHADACLGLAAVRRAGGDLAGWAQATAEAAQLYDRKGASALAETARRTLDAHRSGTPPPPPSLRPSLDNACTRWERELAGAFTRRDWDAIAALQHQDVVFDDRRPFVATQHVGRDAYLRPAFQVLTDRGIDTMTREVHALRGEHLALMTLKAQESDVSSVEIVLAVLDVGSDGLLGSCTVFDVEDLEGATAELDRQYLEGEGAPFAEIVRLVTEQPRAGNAGDWEALGECFAPDVVIGDHHWGGLGERRGRDEVVHSARQSYALASDRWSICAIHPLSSDVVVATMETRGQDTETCSHIVCHRGSHGIDRQEVFGADDLDAALAAGRRLMASSAELSNRCTETYARYLALFAARDWEAMRELVAEGAVFDDRRPVVRTLATGSDIEAQFRHIAAHGVERIAITVLATRGERLALMKVRSESTDPTVELFADEPLTVIELSDSGRLYAAMGFAVEDLGAAVAELDRRYLEGEGAPYARILSLALMAIRAVSRRDWESFGECVAPDAVGRDHVWRLAEARGREEIERIARQSMNVDPGSSLILRRVHAVSNLALAAEMGLSHSAGVGLADSVFHQAFHLGQGGIDRYETFAPDALADALATYHRLSASGTDVLSNRFTQTWERGQEYLAAQNWDAFTALMSEDFVYEDHRSVVGVPAARRPEVVAGMQFQVEQGADQLVLTPLALRGTRLALIRISHQSSLDAENSFASVVLGVARGTDDGRLDGISIYDLVDQDRAIAELDRRYLEGEGAPHAAMLSPALAAVRAINARDWDAWRAYVPPDAVLVEHYYRGWGGAVGREATETMMRQAMDAVPDSRVMVRRIHAVCDSAVAYETRLWHGSDTLGEELFHSVVHLGPPGRVESFGPDALDEALACYRHLAGPVIETLSNRCTETLSRVSEHFASRAWEGLRAALAEGHVYDDHRTVMRAQSVGRRDVLAHLQIQVEQGLDSLVFTPLALRGAYLALVRMVTQSKGDAEDSFASVVIAVVSSTDDGRIERVTAYDPDNEDQAVAELDRRYIQGKGAPYATILSLALDSVRAINARDWETWRSCIAPDAVLVEHLYSGWGDAADREACEALMRLTMAIPDSHLIVRRIHAVSSGSLAFEICLSHGSGTALVVAPSHQVAHLGPSGLDRVESFGPDALDDALAAYRLLAASPLRTASNRCTEAFRQQSEHFAARDWDAFTAAMSEGFVYDDHRSVVTVQSVGRRDAVAHMQIAAEQGADRLVFAVLAIRGASHALIRHGTQSNTDAENSFGSVILGVISCGDDGRLERTTVYDLDDEDRAIADLERRHIEGEGAPYAEILTLLAGAIRAFNQRDWDCLRACFPLDANLVDHYSAGWNSRRGGSDTVAAYMEFADSLLEARSTVPEIHACTTDALLATTVVSGRSEEGGTVEFVFHIVHHRTGQVVDHVESFGSDDLDEARAAYRRLTTDLVPGNRCTEVFGRWADRFATRDWDGLDALMTDDIFNVDHRPVVRLRQVGRDAARRNVQLLAAQGDRVVYTVLATRGERHALLRLGVQSDQDADDSYASVMLGVVTSSPDDLFAGITVFGLDNEESARAELERQCERTQEGR
jgi:class 3 adenylate cyclase/tetratricopeptide (TPR) repeat protein